MAKVTMFRCDYCGKTVDSYYREVGWILLTGVSTVSIVVDAITEGKAARANIKDISNDELMFCSKACLIRFLDDLFLGKLNKSEYDND